MKSSAHKPRSGFRAVHRLIAVFPLIVSQAAAVTAATQDPNAATPILVPSEPREGETTYTVGSPEELRGVTKAYVLAPRESQQESLAIAIQLTVPTLTVLKAQIPVVGVRSPVALGEFEVLAEFIPESEKAERGVGLVIRIPKGESTPRILLSLKGPDADHPLTPTVFGYIFGQAFREANGLEPPVEETVTTGDYGHLASGMTFPARTGAFERGGITQFDEHGNDVGVQYVLRAGESRTTVTVFVYSRGTQAITDSYFTEEMGSVAAAARVTFSEMTMGVEHPLPTGWSPGADRGRLLRLRDRESRSVSLVILLSRGSWFVKYRATYPLSLEDVTEAELPKLITGMGLPNPPRSGPSRP